MSEAKHAKSALSYEDAKRLVASPDARDRRKVAQLTDVKPELLYFLATDTQFDVRRDVATNDSTPWQADEILVEDTSEAVRAELGRKLARLLPGMSAAERDDVRERVVAMLEKLAHDEVVRVRAAVSEAIKHLDCVPRKMVQKLARDMALAVSEPVLRFSPMLSDADLLAIIAGPHADGALAAIAGRATVAGPVADAIGRAADEAAITVLLANPSAQIREETLDLIIDKAPNRPRWHPPLVDRPSLPARLAKRLAGFIADTLLNRLASRKDLDGETRSALAKAVQTRLEPPPKAPEPEKPKEEEKNKKAPAKEEEEEVGETAEDRARRMKKEGKLDENVVAAALDKSDRAFVRAALALLALVQGEVVDKIFGARSPKGIIALVWKAGLSVRLAHQVQLRMAGISPRQALGPKGGTWPLTKDEMNWHLEFFAT
jgi:uncharacterized protein (DUF2336 family)